MTKTVMITGASRGIGEAAARIFAAQGWLVAATARRPETLGNWAHAPNVAAIRLDVTDVVSVRQAVGEIESRLGPVDVLVNNAGAGLGGAVEGVTREELSELFDLNFFGLISTIQAVLPGMREKSSGVIINVSSAAGRVGLPFLAPYCASKYAVEGLTEAMAYELAPFGVQVKLIEPGGVKTSFEHKWAESAAYERGAAATRARYVAGSKKAMGPEGVAKAIYLAATDGKSRLRYTANGAGPLMALNRFLPAATWRALVQSSFG